ncbi:MAG: hypothetical protein ACXAC2_19420 [Candidatus Kariarchaeaceae archaeon]
MGLISNRIVSGPFKNQICSYGSLSRRLGTWEKELYPIVYEIVKRKFKTIINVGSHDGYYCIGFACLLQDSKVIAFEADKNWKQRLVLNAKENNVDNLIEVNDICGINDLRSALCNNENPCVFMDVDGGEFFLLDPCLIPELIDKLIVVEYHEHVIDNIAEILKSRFRNTHKIVEIYQQPRTISDFPLTLHTYAVVLLDKYLIDTMNEFRPAGNHWLLMYPHLFNSSNENSPN